jgi:hypothetical protein
MSLVAAVRRVAFGLVAVTLAAPQTKGPLEIKDPPPKRTDTRKEAEPPGKKEPNAPSTKEAPPGVWREVVTDAEGRVLVARGKEIAGHASVHDTPEMRPLQQAREVAAKFTDELPDYTCEQLTWLSKRDPVPRNGSSTIVSWRTWCTSKAVSTMSTLRSTTSH